MSFSPEILNIDAEREIARITETIRFQLGRILKRRGAVLGLSGGIDSSVTAALCQKAVGEDRVFTIFMPEGESAESKESLELGKLVADHLGVASTVEDITDILAATKCYERRDEAIKQTISEYQPSWKSKIVLPSVIDTDQYRIFSVVVQKPDGTLIKARLSTDAYLAIVAATNFKQRTRKTIEYYYADKLNFAVAGTPNLLEYDQGFFVKQGDSMGDFKPIAHLYKTQVYALAEALGLPEEIRKRPPTTDTYSLAQSQEEFYFSLPYHQMDLCLYAVNNNIPSNEVATVVGIPADAVERVFKDIQGKRRTTLYGHLPPLLVEDVEPIKRNIADATQKRGMS